MPQISPADRLHVALMLVLTFSTGIIDATAYIGLDHVFTGNMTGNVVILGMGLLGADHLPVVGPLISLAGYIVGAAIAGRVLRPIKDGWTAHCTVLFGIVGGILAIAALCAIRLHMHEVATPVMYAITGALSIAMGVQAGAARHVGVEDVTTVVITATITGLASDSVFGARRSQPWGRRAAAVALISLGACAGAALVHVSIALPIGVAALFALAVSALGHRGSLRGAAERANLALPLVE